MPEVILAWPFPGVHVNDTHTKDLIIRLQGGDVEALGLLYDRYRMLVYRTALGITANPEVAADLVQEVFLRMHRFAMRIDPLRPLEPWLYRVTANLAYTWASRQKRWLHMLETLMERVSTPHTDAEQQVLQSEEWRQVQRALMSLPVAQRVVVTLFYLNDLSVAEIAEVLNLPEGTVKSRLHYGRKALRQALDAGEESVLAKVQYEFT